MCQLKKIKVFLVFIIFTLIFTHRTNAVYKYRGLKPSYKNIPDWPQISIDAYSRPDAFQTQAADVRFNSLEQFENNFASKNGSDYVIYEGTSLVVFKCEAGYPVTWVFPFPEQLNHINLMGVLTLDKRTSYFSWASEEPRNNRFQSYLVIQKNYVEFLSTNLVCVEILDIKYPARESSSYIYIKSKFGIENQGQTINVSVDTSTTQDDPLKQIADLPPVILPCRPASPDIKLAIEKEDVTGNPGNDKSWKSLNFPENDLSFDPKIGFTLKRGLLGNQIFGLYRCSVILIKDNEGIGNHLLHDNQYVLINVINETRHTFEDEVFQPRSIISGNARVQLSEGLDGIQIECCSGVKDKPPKLIRKTCNSLFTCQLLKESILKGTKADKIYESEGNSDQNGCKVESFQGNLGLTEIVVCRGENVDFMEEYTEIFHPMAGGPVTNRSIRIAGHETKKNDNDKLTSLSIYETSANVEKAPVDQKIILLVGRRTEKRNKDLLAPFVMFDPQFRDLLDKSSVGIHDKNAPWLDILEKIHQTSDKIIEYNRDVFYVGEQLTFMCFGVKKFYSENAHLRVNFEDGSKLVLDSDDDTKIGREKPRRILYLKENGNMFQGDGRALASIFGKTVNASQNIISVDCWMPRINSQIWDNISKSFTVLNGVAPSYVEPDFVINENENKDKSGIALPITLTICGVLGLIVIGLGVKCWRDKRTVTSTSPRTSINF